MGRQLAKQCRPGSPSPALADPEETLPGVRLRDVRAARLGQYAPLSRRDRLGDLAAKLDRKEHPVTGVTIGCMKTPTSAGAPS